MVTEHFPVSDDEGNRVGLQFMTWFCSWESGHTSKKH